jgi:DNA-binding beta-propeller fold protein YncE
MMTKLLSSVSLLAMVAGSACAAAPGATHIPTGQFITPAAAPGAVFGQLNPHVASAPNYTVGQAQTTTISPDGKTMLVLTSGYNLWATPQGTEDTAVSNEFVFVFDISGDTPVQLQALPVPTTFSGIVWRPDSQGFYVGGGQSDNVHIFTKVGGSFAETGTPIVLGNTAYGVNQPAGLGLYSIPGSGEATTPMTGGMAITADGTTLVVANLENDSVSLINTATNTKIGTQSLRPGDINPAQNGVSGGGFPYWVAIKGSNTIYVSSMRDREIDVLSLNAGVATVTARIKVAGNPSRMVLNQAQTKLFVTADNSDMLYVIDTASNSITGKVKTTAPLGYVTSGANNGAMPNSVTLSPDESTAYVTNGGTNSVAVVDISGVQPVVTGLIPTGWQPTSVSISPDGKQLYVVNAKSNTGPNPLYPTTSANNYDWQLTKAGFLTMPVPSAADLLQLTSMVAGNNGFNLQLNATDAETMSFLRNHIQHVIYIVKENRTYDQILGDLPIGNGDKKLAMYGAALTPNFHNIATQFVDLDQYRDSGICSMDGWQYSTSGRGRDLNEKIVSVNYSKNGGSYDSEGTTRGVNTAWATPAQRLAVLPFYGAQAISDPNLLPGTANPVAPDGPAGEQGAGFIWNAAMRAKLSFRNYGFMLDLTGYSVPASFGQIPVLRYPFQTKTVVAFPADASMLGRTDPYFRGFDNQLPDFYRYQEWAREFDGQVKTGKFPNFETVRFMHDHTGNFDTALDGVNTPELQQADNDYAVGLLVDKIAHSPYAGSTLVFVTEDDSQDGPDHVDSHRSIGFVVGPYVKQGAVVSRYYSTVSMLRTMGDILGLEKLSVQVAGVKPMTDVFDLTKSSWTYSAIPAQLLLTNTTLPILNKDKLRRAGVDYTLRHDAAWWAAKTKQFSFTKEDQNDEAAYNRVLWEGTMGKQPYPAAHSGD